MRAQSFREFELVVMDGASTDGTVDLLKASEDIIGTWRSEADSGLYNAWNKGLRHAKGEWICFLGADDWLWDEGALERLAPHLRAAAPRHRVVYSRVRCIDAKGRVVEERGEPWQRARLLLRRGSCLPHPGLMHHRSIFELYGAFDERFKLAADYELLLRELKTGDAMFVPTLTAGMNDGGMSARPENFYRILCETRQALVIHGLTPPRLLWAYQVSCAWLYVRLRAVVGDRAARRLADLYRLASLRRPRYSAQ